MSETIDRLISDVKRLTKERDSAREEHGKSLERVAALQANAFDLVAELIEDSRAINLACDQRNEVYERNKDLVFSNETSLDALSAVARMVGVEAFWQDERGIDFAPLYAAIVHLLRVYNDSDYSTTRAEVVELRSQISTMRRQASEDLENLQGTVDYNFGEAL